MDAGDQADPVLEAGGSLAPRFTAGCQPPSASLCPPPQAQPPEGPLVWGLPCSACLVLWACAPPGLRYLFPTASFRSPGSRPPAAVSSSSPEVTVFLAPPRLLGSSRGFHPRAAGGRSVLLRAGYTLVLGCSRLVSVLVSANWGRGGGLAPWGESAPAAPGCRRGRGF